MFHPYSVLPVNLEISENVRNTAMSAHTIVDPTGVEHRMERMIPTAAQVTDMIAEQRMTALKLRNSRMAESAGKMISAEISKEPTKFIARTMIIAVMTAISRL